MELPYLTADLPGVGGRIKVNAADFRVVELPLYTPCGHGEHTYLRIEKTGIPTFEAVRRVARALRIDPRSVGYAGLKDAHAIAEQTLSLGDVPPAQVEQLDVPGVRVLSVDRHTNKLRPGHLRGNRFTIRIRDAARIRDTARIRDSDRLRDVPGSLAAGAALSAAGAALSAAQAILDVLARYGVPNYFGEQRFGLRGDTHLLGRALVRKDAEAFIGRLVGSAQGEATAAESPAVRRARGLYESGDLQASLSLWPRHMQAERRVVQRLIDRPGDVQGAVRAIPNKMRSFYVSAYQSALFNRVLARRMVEEMPESGVDRESGPGADRPDSGRPDSGRPDFGRQEPRFAWERLGTLVYGDLAYIHNKGAVFLVDRPAEEQARADRLEISPSGPLYGFKLTPAQGAPGEMERQVLAEEGLALEDFRLRGLRLKGARRPLRFPLREAAVEEDEEGLVISFSLPPGCYATVVLREVIKGEL